MEFTQQHIVAHRGYQKHYPENTLLSVRKAIEVGALHVEVDVQLSRDQTPMVYHDDTLERMSGRAGKVCEFSAAELQQFSAHDPGRFDQQFVGEKIATLKTLVDEIGMHPDVTFYIELKEESIRDHGADICLKKIRDTLNPVLDQCVLISFDVSALLRAKQSGFGRVGPVLRNWETRDAAIDTLRAIVMFINKKRIPARGQIEANCPVVIYEIDDVGEAVQLLRRGATRVESFAVGEMINGLGSI